LCIFSPEPLHLSPQRGDSSVLLLQVALAVVNYQLLLRFLGLKAGDGGVLAT
jgi:hypothetical protein